MNHAIAFTLPTKGKNLYRLPLGSTLLHFVAFDMSYFIDQATSMTEYWSTTGNFMPDQLAVLRDYLRKCHPYFQILVNDDFAEIGLDFAIDHLCHSQHIGLETMWAQHISDRYPFWQAVFYRISAYKTGRAINQWDNLLRMRDYAASKIAFIYDGEQEEMSEYRVRKEYYDLAFTLIGEQLGFGAADLPQISCYNTALLGGARAIMGRLSHDMLNTVQPLTPQRKIAKPAGRSTAVTHDQTAGIISNALVRLQRPGPLARVAAVETCESLPRLVYVPSSFKAVIDLEFNHMIENGIALKRSPLTGSFELLQQEEAATENLAAENEDDVLLAGEDMPHAEPEPAPEAAAPQDGRPQFPRVSPEEVTFPLEKNEDTAQPAFAPPPTAPAQPRLWSTRARRRQPEPKAYTSEALQYIHKIANDPSHYPNSQHIEEDINLRCQLIQSELRNQIGRSENPAEFQQWSRDLMQIRIKIVRKELSMDYLQRYLDATEEVFDLHLKQSE